MTLPVTPPTFQNPPSTYDAVYVQGLLRELNQLVQRLNAAGALQATTINLSNLPTASTDLRSGDVYVDSDGFLKILTGTIPAYPAGMVASLGAVTTSP